MPISCGTICLGKKSQSGQAGFSDREPFRSSALTSHKQRLAFFLMFLWAAIYAFSCPHVKHVSHHEVDGGTEKRDSLRDSLYLMNYANDLMMSSHDLLIL